MKKYADKGATSGDSHDLSSKNASRNIADKESKTDIKRNR